MTDFEGLAGIRRGSQCFGRGRQHVEPAVGAEQRGGRDPAAKLEIGLNPKLHGTRDTSVCANEPKTEKP
ncbi:hypothetical protein [Kibdelosporangium aridum]|uniref:hypothetical protein n=1 Tax=Kibdelosporangium aridum TaxID=2030 RepID=UPI000F79D049|nr:hypothetical protein [Kibdelosporangium aridum]